MTTDAGRKSLLRARNPRSLTIQLGAFLIAVIASTGCSPSGGAALPLSGGCAPSSAPLLEQDSAVEGRVGFCVGGDAATGSIDTRVMDAGTRSVQLMMAGYPETEGVKLQAVSEDGKHVAEIPVKNIGERWRRTPVLLPESFPDVAFRLRLLDDATGGFGWAGIGVSTRSLGAQLSASGLPILICVLGAHTWLMLAGLLLARGTSTSNRAIGGMLMLGAAGSATIAGYVIGPRVGGAVAAILLMLPAVVLMVRWHRRSPSIPSIADVTGLVLLTLPAPLLAVLVLWVGLFPLDWNGQDWLLPGLRWIDMPQDIWLPYMFADMLHHGRIDVPMIGDWLSSDRPPLQSGIYLLFDIHHWGVKGGLIYQAVSTWAQALVLVPVAILVRDRNHAVTAGAIIFAVAISGLVIFNSLFVWPKLVAAAFCAIYHIELLRTRAHRDGALDTGSVAWLPAGLAAALAMLSHGGALFMLVGSTTVFILKSRRHRAIRPLTAAGAVAIAAYLPWILYQRFLDPPGDRLVKWHFGGQIEPTSRSLGEVLQVAYGKIGWNEWLDGRIANVNTLFQGATVFPRDVVQLFSQHDISIAHRVVDKSFYFLSYSMWFASPLLLVPLALIVAWRRSRGGTAPTPLPNGLPAAAGISLLFWLAAMYLPGSTILHQGAYLSFIFVLMTTLVLLSQASKPLLLIVVAMNTAVCATAYFFDRPLASLPFSKTYVVVTVSLLAGLLLASWRSGAGADDAPRVAAG